MPLGADEVLELPEEAVPEARIDRPVPKHGRVC